MWSVNTFGWPSPTVYGWLPLAAALGTAVLIAWRAPRHPAAFAAGMSLTLLVLVMFAKQAFGNYYFLVAGAAVVAAYVWPTGGVRQPHFMPAWPGTRRTGRTTSSGRLG